MSFTIAPYIAINKDRNIFRITQNSRLIPVSQAHLAPQEKIIRDLKITEWYRKPFEYVAAVSDRKIISKWKLGPSAFHLVSPLDYADAISRHMSGEMVYPLDVNVTLTDRCNFACNLCINRADWESGKPGDLPADAYIKTLAFIVGKGGAIAQSISCGGSGEAIIHPEFIRVLNEAHAMGIKTFFTTNGSRNDDLFINTVAGKASAVVFSFHGIYKEAFKKLENPPKKITFERIVNTISEIRKKRDDLGRYKDLIIGVNTLVHPENAGHYKEFIDRMHGLKVDCINFNPILPSPEKYGLNISQKDKNKLQEEFSLLNLEFKSSDIPIRMPGNIFPQEEKQVYFNPNIRKHPENCFIALLQPSFHPADFERHDIKITSCRYYPNCTNDSNYYYTDALMQKGFEDVWNSQNISRIQDQASRCYECSSQRQLMFLDWLADTKKKNKDIKFMLIFPIELEKGKIITFKETLGGEEQL